MTKHTPGPWRTVRMASSFDSTMSGYGIAYGRAGNRLAIVDGEGNSSHQNEANARLIAAAPDLLDALKKVQARLDWDKDHDIAPSVEKLVRAAIAKAEGRS